MSDNAAYLVLENGAAFKGRAFGAQADAVAEIVFTTGMTGYLETLTDPSYHGQIVVQTFPLIGNYGVIPADFESASARPSGYIVRSPCRTPSNFRCEGTLDDYLKERGIPGLYGIDTRALVKLIRENGVMNGAITADPGGVDLNALKRYKITGAVEAESGRGRIIPCDKGAARFRVVLIDYGLKENIARSLTMRGCEVITAHCGASAKEILSLNPDGVMLSNGPGNPADAVECVRVLEKLCAGGAPIFGICLGHQLLALANGFKTAKLKYGHRGANQPVRDLRDGRVYITSQNHGYAVQSDSVAAGARVSFENVNDLTCEGIEYPDGRGFSVQFHPEACAGPRDAAFLFDRFIDAMKEYAGASR